MASTAKHYRVPIANRVIAGLAPATIALMIVLIVAVFWQAAEMRFYRQALDVEEARRAREAEIRAAPVLEYKPLTDRVDVTQGDDYTYSWYFKKLVPCGGAGVVFLRDVESNVRFATNTFEAEAQRPEGKYSFRYRTHYTHKSLGIEIPVPVGSYRLFVEIDYYPCENSQMPGGTYYRRQVLVGGIVNVIEPEKQR